MVAAVKLGRCEDWFVQRQWEPSHRERTCQNCKLGTTTWPYASEQDGHRCCNENQALVWYPASSCVHYYTAARRVRRTEVSRMAPPLPQHLLRQPQCDILDSQLLREPYRTLEIWRHTARTRRSRTRGKPRALCRQQNVLCTRHNCSLARAC